MTRVALVVHREAILRVAEQHGARNVRLFGSVARGDERPERDIDLLVDLDPDRTLLDLVALHDDLEQLLERSVDVITEAGLRARIKDRVLAGAVPL